MPMVYGVAGGPPSMWWGEDFGISYTTADIQRNHAAKRRAAKPSGHLILPRK